MRFLPACLTSAALVLAGTLTQTSAQPPEKPAAEKKAHHAKRAKLVQKVYPVADLIIPLDETVTKPIVANLSAGEKPRSRFIPVEKVTGSAPPSAPRTAARPPAVAPAVLEVPQASTCCPPCRKTAACPAAPARTLEDKLTRLIVSSIKPRSWDQMGGPGTLDYYPLGMALVVKQTPEVHEQIAELLAALRRLQDVEVAVEVRFISVSASLYEQLVSAGCGSQEFRAEAVPGTPLQCYTASCREPLLRCLAGGGASTACLNDEQVRQFLQAAQEDPRTSVMQAPKMTLLNGQTATCNITDRLFFVTGVTAVQAGGQIVACPQNESFTTGLQMSVQPLVSTDRRSVYVNLKLNQTNLATAAVPLFPVVSRLTPELEGGAKDQPVPFTQYIQQPRFNTVALERSLKIREGGTMFLGGWKQENESRTEFGPPVLSKIPYLNRFFKNVGYGRDTSYVLVMVTPRVIVNEEEEHHVASGISPTTTPSTTSTSPWPSTCSPWAQPPCCAEPAQPCCVPCCPAPMPPPVEASLPSREGTVAKLLHKYQKACAAVHLDEAEMLARQALALDPACFSKPAARAAGKNRCAPVDR
jgi:hypothetical protein